MFVLMVIVAFIAWTIFACRIAYKSALGRPAIWSDAKLNNQRFYILSQGPSRTGGYYAVLKRVDPFAEPHCYKMDKPLPNTPMFDRGNSVDEITAVNLGGDPIFKPWKPA